MKQVIVLLLVISIALADISLKNGKRNGRPRARYIPPRNGNGNGNGRPNGNYLPPTNGNGNGREYLPPNNGYAANGGYADNGPEEAPAKYEFQYQVSEPQEALEFGHKEQRDGDLTEGEYNVLLPDGRTQIVTYTVDGDAGYVAEVKYEGEANNGGYQYPNGGYQY